MLKELLKKFPKLRDKQVKKKKVADNVILPVVYRSLQVEVNDLLVAMMADLIKIDQRDNKAAGQRFRVNSVKFSKVAKAFRKASLQVKKVEHDEE